MTLVSERRAYLGHFVTFAYGEFTRQSTREGMSFDDSKPAAQCAPPRWSLFRSGRVICVDANGSRPGVRLKRAKDWRVGRPNSARLFTKS